MDAQGNIYAALNVPPEDKARLDGYLRGRAEADLLKAEMERSVEKVREMEDREGGKA